MRPERCRAVEVEEAHGEHDQHGQAEEQAQHDTSGASATRRPLIPGVEGDRLGMAAVRQR